MLDYVKKARNVAEELHVSQVFRRLEDVSKEEKLDKWMPQALND